MYLKYWGLTAAPFRQELAPSLFYETPTHNEALARLAFLVDGRRRCGLLAGPSGIGKSMLLEVAASQFRRRGLSVARLSLLGANPDELLRSLAVQWGSTAAPRLEMSELWRILQDRLAEIRLLGEHAVALLDDADETSAEILGQVLRLLQTDPAQQPAVTVILVARNDSVSRLGARLLELTDLRLDLAAWSALDTRRFLERALASAGCKAPLFTADAIAHLHEYTHGVPRSLLQLADLSLVAGAAEERELIDSDTVESVYYELGVIETLA
ncbi:MAG TPA: AAA family ATPase [Pirellulales bacterium]|jgi:general secretion pathway protein A